MQTLARFALDKVFNHNFVKDKIIGQDTYFIIAVLDMMHDKLIILKQKSWNPIRRWWFSKLMKELKIMKQEYEEIPNN